jgi:hypothetical protein
VSAAHHDHRIVGLSLLGATAAGAVPAHAKMPAHMQLTQIDMSHLQVSPDACKAGFAEIWIKSGGSIYYLVGQGIDKDVVLGGDNYCWNGGSFNKYGLIKNESNGCLGYNSETVTVQLQTCNASVSSQQWEPEQVPGGGTSYCNKWGVENLDGCLLSAEEAMKGAAFTLVPDVMGPTETDAFFS